MTLLATRAGRVARRITPSLGLALVLGCAALLLLYLGRDETFFYDEWTFLTDRRGGGTDPFLLPHNEHLSLIPAIVYKLLWATAGLDAYPVYRALLVAVHVGVGVVVYLLARPRIGPWAAVIAVVPVAFLGRGWEDLLWAFQIGFVGSVLTGVAALLALDRDDRRGDVIAAALLTASLACSSIGIPFVIGAAAELAVTRRWRRLVTVLAAPVVLYGAWYLGHGHSTLKRENVFPGVEWALDAAATAVGSVFGQAPEWGRPLAIAAIAGLAWAVSRPGVVTPRLVGLAAVGGSFWLLTGIGRSGISPPDTPRYTYIGVVVVVLLACELLRGRTFAPRVLRVGAALALLAVLLGANELRSGSRFLRGTSQIVRAELGAIELLGARAPADMSIDPKLAPTLRAGQYLEAVRDVGDSPANSPAELVAAGGEPRFNADKVLLLGGGITSAPASTEPALATTPPPVDGADGGATPDAGCVRTSAGKVDLTVPPAGLFVRAAADAQVTFGARRFFEDFQNPDVLKALPPGTSAVLNAPADRSAQPWHIRLDSPASVTVCALAG